MDTHPGRGSRQTIVALLAALLCATALGACGGGSDEDDVREVAEQIAGNDPAVCDKVTDDFLDQIDATKEECRESAEEEDEGDEPEVEEVTVDGDTATALIVDEDRTTLEFVKRDEEWLIDGVRESESASGEDEDEAPEATEAPAEDEVDARAAADALLIGVRDADEQVLCGLLDERYAQKLTGATEFGIAECVQALEGQDFSGVKRTLRGVESDEVELQRGGERATVTLTNGGGTLSLRKDGDRYVITGGLD